MLQLTEARHFMTSCTELLRREPLLVQELVSENPNLLETSFLTTLLRFLDRRFN